MPEIVTKYPDIVLQILKEAGIKCGAGEKQQILKTCPSDRFCSLPTGEICVYGIKDVSKMTQITPIDIFQTGWMNITLLMMIFFCGFFIGTIINKKRKKQDD